MQNRYAGDVGDFGKLGMLRRIEKSGISVGVNWYLVGDENHNNDGKHIGYLENEKFRGCDDELLEKLRSMIAQKHRTVFELENLEPLKTKKYFYERLYEPKRKDCVTRSEWHAHALNSMTGCDLVFLDPDNGLLPKSVGSASDKSIKYVLPEEIIDYYKAGHSVVFYSHRTREQLEVYLQRFANLFNATELHGATVRGLSYRRGTVRDYFFIIHEAHLEKIEAGIQRLVDAKWREHFSVIEI